MSQSQIIQPGDGSEKPKLKRKYQINDLFKVAFIAGASVGVDLARNPTPLRTLAALEEIGHGAFAHLFTEEIVGPETSARSIDFFDQLWTQMFEGRQ